MDVGIIGLGAMGRAMAQNLAAAGHRVVAWNRSATPIDGVKQAVTLSDALQGDAAFTMLSDDAAIRSVLLDPGTLRQARPGLVHIVSSTISVAFARELVRAHAEAGLGYVSAPVLGRPDVAARGELNVLAAGDPPNVSAVRPLLEVVGSRVWDLGAEPPTANAAKIACNMMITMAIEAMAEAVVLAEGYGLGREPFFDLILGTLFGSRSYQVYSGKIAARDYEAGFKAVLGLKDLRLASEAAEGIGRDLPMLDAVRRCMAEAVEAGLGHKDWSIMAGLRVDPSKDP
ncbi:NAD(P)-dependent oxidoreductase [Salinarimonas soli]|uniref:NAD(P)-dependent oxidoreductase n=1 Tax=Salinarimonas soli TaxID=1638099 RepID=A0A5B2V4X8_9HYPH|nr:NAD(P)-dependent oxidoreductase [Salinarimonas soli]KAA2234583.1 NAD(P)-dependent oxidoreductase [Salinarimonas soli]